MKVRKIRSILAILLIIVFMVGQFPQYAAAGGQPAQSEPVLVPAPSCSPDVIQVDDSKKDEPQQQPIMTALPTMEADRQIPYVTVPVQESAVTVEPVPTVELKPVLVPTAKDISPTQEEIGDTSVIDETYGQESTPVIPANNSLKPVLLAAGESHTLRVNNDGTVQAWGNNDKGQLGIDGATKKVVSTKVSGIQSVSAVSAGGGHSLALKNDGTVWTWGSNDKGQLGDGTAVNSSIPVQAKNLEGITAVAAGGGHSLALKNDGTVWTWGSNSSGQLGDGTVADSSIPVQVKNLEGITAVAAGGSHSLALKNDGTVWAWGSNSNGQLGDGTAVKISTPVQVKDLNGISFIAAGKSHSLALKNDGTVWAWGYNGYGQLGCGTYSMNIMKPVQAQGLADIIAIASGESHSLALKSDGTVWTWGEGGTAVDSRVPVQIKELNGMTFIAAGGSHSLALKNDGTVWAWGSNSSGQLGDGTASDRNAPVISKDVYAPTMPGNLSAISQENGITLTWMASTDEAGVEGYEIIRDGTKIGTAAGTSYIDSDKPDNICIYRVSAYDGSGNLSKAAVVVLNDTEAPSDPVNLRVISETAAVSLEWEASDDNVGVEGYEIYRDGVRIGNVKDLNYMDFGISYGKTYIYTVRAYDNMHNLSKDSALVSVTTKHAALAAGVNHSLRVSNDGTVWVWGENCYGQLGDGTTTDSAVPIQVKGLNNVVSAAAGEYHSLALKSDGTIWAWGENYDGQLGNGTTISSDIPVRVKELNGIVAVAAGDFHSIALKSDGTVWAWGENYDGQLGNGTTTESVVPVQMEEVYDVIGIAANKDLTAVLRRDGTVWACGQWSIQKSLKPVQIKGLSGVASIAAGYEHIIALKNDGTVWALGDNGYGQLGNGTTKDSIVPVQVKELNGVVSMAAGDYSSYALKDDGTVWAWGCNYSGQLGDGTTTSSNVPVRVKGLNNIAVVTAGYFHCLALKTDGTVWTWGSNSNGQLGDGTTEYKSIPIVLKDINMPAAPTGLSIIKKESSLFLTWTASTDDTGVKGYEIFRDGVMIGTTYSTEYTDADILHTNKMYIYEVKAFDNEKNISEAAVAVWGDDEKPSAPSELKVVYKTASAVWLEWKASKDNFGVEGYEVYRNGVKVGDVRATSYADIPPYNTSCIYTIRAYDKSHNFSDESEPASVTTDKFKTILAAASWSFRVACDGSLWAWGYNYNGNLGDGTTSSRITSTKIQGIKDVVSVVAGGVNSLALKSDGTVWAWGYNDDGQLGNGTTTDSTVPVQVIGLNGVVAVAGGYSHSLALKSDGTVWAWGDNGYGQLGDSTYMDRLLPVQVKELSGIIAVAAGGDHSLALKSDGTVWAWGQNYNGQLGNGTTTNSTVPVQVKELSGISVTAIAGGNSRSLALKSDGTVWAWGDNYHGQLGNGTTADSTVPVQVKELKNIVSISAGGNGHSLALKSDGTVWAWGDNSSGQLGDGTTTDSAVPVQVKELKDVVSISAGWSHSLALKSDGTLWAWGDNEYGQLGDGTVVDKKTPVLLKETDVQKIPIHLSVSIKENSVALTWTPGNMAGTIEYDIFRDGIKIGTVTGTSYTDTSVGTGKICVYTVKACDAGGNVLETVSAVLNDTEKPSVPGGLKVVSKTATTVFLEWEASTDNLWVEGYEIYRNGIKIGTSDRTSYSDMTVPHCTAHKYTLKAYDRSGNLSEESSAVSVTTDSLKSVILGGGSNYSLAVKSDGTVQEWGNSSYSVTVNGISNVVGVAAGYNHRLALRNDGTVWAWGDNSNGQFGDGTIASSSVPVQIKELNGVIAVVAANDSSAVLKNDGTVWIWGSRNIGLRPVQLKELDNIIAIAPGTALKSDGTVWTWDYNLRIMQIKQLSGIIAVAAGEYHSLALKSDGTVWAWGENYNGQLGDGTTTKSEIPVQVKELSDVTAVATGRNHSLALKSDGTVWSWGYNSNGQLGDGTTTRREIPVQVKELSDVTAIAAGEYHSLALKSDGTIWAWGNNYYEQIGDGTSMDRNTPVLLKDVYPPTIPTGLSAYIDGDKLKLIWKASTDNVSVKGYKIYCNGIPAGEITDTVYTETGILPDKIYVYKVTAYDGENNVSEEAVIVLNDTERPSVPSELKVTSKTETSVSLEWKASVDNVWVEGYEVYRNGVKIGDTKDTSFTDLTAPSNTTHIYTIKAYDKSFNLSDESNKVSVKTDAIKTVSLAAGAYHSLALKSDGMVWQSGQLRSSWSNTKSTVYKQFEISEVTAVAAGNGHSLALKSDGTVWAWGYNEYGQLGDGTIVDKGAKPVQVLGLTNVISIAAGECHSFALKSDGTVWAWGHNSYGQLGDGTTVGEAKPIQVLGLTNVISIAAGEFDSFALKSDGTVWAWGYNGYGQLGDGTTEDKTKPVQVLELTNVISIAAGGYHGFVLKSDGTVWAWGYNGYGQLGDGTTVGKTKPVQVLGLTNVISIAAGGYHSFALKSDGTVWTWGYNYYGQLGDGTTEEKTRPVQVLGLTNVISIAAGGYHSIAQKSDGTFWAWGRNSYGQLGDGTNITRITPVASVDVCAPAAPLNLTARSSDTEVVLYWQCCSDDSGISKYEIYRDGEKIAEDDKTYYRDRSIETGKAYVYTVKAVDGAGNISGASNEVINDTQAPFAPPDLAVASRTAASITLVWTASADNIAVKGYNVYRDGVCIGTSYSTSYTDTVLKPDTSYTYSIEAFDAGGNYSLTSPELTISTCKDTTVPTIPGNLSISQGDDTHYTLAWIKSVDDVKVAGYEIYRDGVKIGTKIAGSSSDYVYYDDTGIKVGHTYVYTVRAYDDAGNISMESEGVTITDDYGNTRNTAVAVQLGNEIAGNIDYASDTDFLVFTAPIDGVYTITLSSLNSKRICLYDGNPREQTGQNIKIESKLSASKSYYILIDGYIGGTYKYSGEYSVKVTLPSDTEKPAAPSGLTVLSKSEAVVKLEWSGAQDNIGIAGYEICRDGVSIGNTGGVSDKTNYTDAHLVPGKAYRYTVRAYDMAGNTSEDSNEISVTTDSDTEAPVASQNLRVTKKLPTSVSLSWDASSDNAWVSGYIIYRDGVKIGTTESTAYTHNFTVTATSCSYSVKAYDISGNISEESNAVICDNTAPDIVEDVQLVLKSDLSVTLDWAEPFDNVGTISYEIYRDGVKVGTSADAEYTDTLLQPETDYTYTVKAIDAAGNISKPSKELKVKTEPDTQPPSVPLNLNCLPGASNSVTLAWTASTDNIRVTGYQIYRDGSKVGSTVNTAYTDEGIDKSKNYVYTVRAFDSSGNVSDNSKPAVLDGIAPSVPLNLKVASRGSNVISIAWSASTDNVAVAGYEIYRNGIKAGTVKDTFYTDTGLELDKKYRYTVKAYDKANNVSGLSDGIDAETILDNELPSAPSDLKIHRRTGSTVTLNWTASTDDTGVAGYKIYRNEKEVGASLVTSYTDTKLAVDTVYTYSIKAFDASGNLSKASDTIGAMPLKPEIVKVSPSNLEVIGGAAKSELRVYFSVSNEREGVRAKFEYSTDGSEWKTILGTITGPVAQDPSTKYFSCQWDLYPIKTGEYRVRYTVYDEAEAESHLEVVYEVDREAPSTPSNLKIDSVYGEAQMSWECAPEANVTGYRVYRGESISGRFLPIKAVEGRMTGCFTDTSVKEGNTYYYKITAVDKFGQESRSSNIVSAVIVGGDIEKPSVISIKPANKERFRQEMMITVEAMDNVMVMSIKLQYSLDKGQTWADIDSVFTKGKNIAEFKWTPEINGEVYVRAIAVDRAGNESDGTLQRQYIIDRQGPGKIVGLSKAEYANSIVLSWDDVEDEDFSYFEVEQKDSPDGSFRSAGRVNDKLGMQITGLSCNSTYWFRVVAYDVLGNRGTYSDEIEVTTTKDVYAPVIMHIGPAPGYYSDRIRLQANARDNEGVKTFTFQISYDMKMWKDVAVLEQEGSPLYASVNYDMDISGMKEGNFYIRSIASDESGNSTGGSSFVEYRIDHTPPGQPEGFKATFDYSHITLIWDKGKEDDLNFYRVYRSTAETGPYTLLKDNVLALGYIDSGATENTTYYYKVTAVDCADNESLAAGPMKGALLESGTDAEKPEIITISPPTGSMLPANPTIGILVEDNYKVASVTAEYRVQADQAAEWKLIGTADVDKYRDIVEFKWNTSGMSDGNYTVIVTAKDTAGNVSDAKEVNYRLNVEPPAAPVLTASAGDFKAVLSWTCGEESDLAGFLIYRSMVQNSFNDYECINSTKYRSYTDDSVEPEKTYYYMVKAVDIRGNSSWSNKAQVIPTGKDTVLPVAVAGEEQTAIVGTEVELDGRGSYDNDRIASYEWDFGDGNTAKTARAVHIYTKEGEYNATLTVYDPAGNKASSVTKVNVVAYDKACGVEIKIVDESDGACIPNAKVLVQSDDGTVKEFASNSRGIVKLSSKEGMLKIFAYKNDYSSVEGEAILEKGKSVKTTLCLKKSSIMVGELKVKRMTLDEIVNAGIDVNDPQNQWVYECEIHLGFTPVTFTVNGSGGILGGYGGGYGWNGYGWNGYCFSYGEYYIYPNAVSCPQHPEVAPTIYYLVIPAKVSWVKEFFEVTLIMQNTSEAGSPFVVTNSSAELKAPDGLTFIPSDFSSNTVVEMGNIAPEEVKEAKWVLRGDKKGSYNIRAEFNGILQPFGENINAVYTTKDPVKVWGEDAVVMHVKAEDYTFEGEPYLVMVNLENVSDAELYNVSLDIKQGENYTIAPECQTPAVFEKIKPREVKEVELWLIPSFTGKLDLSKSFIVKTDGNATIKTTLGSISASKALLQVQTDSNFVEADQDNYYTYDIIADIKDWRDTAENVTAEIELSDFEGIQNIQFIGSDRLKVQLGTLEPGMTKTAVWRIKFKAVSATSSLDYIIKVSGDNARSKKISGFINAGNAKFKLALDSEEKGVSDDGYCTYTIKASISNSGGIAKNAKASIKILSESEVQYTQLVSDTVQYIGIVSKKVTASWDIKFKPKSNSSKIEYQVIVSADNAQNVTQNGVLTMEGGLIIYVMDKNGLSAINNADVTITNEKGKKMSQKTGKEQSGVAMFFVKKDMYNLNVRKEGYYDYTLNIEYVGDQLFTVVLDNEESSVNPYIQAAYYEDSFNDGKCDLSIQDKIIELGNSQQVRIEASVNWRGCQPGEIRLYNGSEYTSFSGEVFSGTFDGIFSTEGNDTYLLAISGDGKKSQMFHINLFFKRRSYSKEGGMKIIPAAPELEMPFKAQSFPDMEFKFELGPVSYVSMIEDNKTKVVLGVDVSKLKEKGLISSIADDIGEWADSMERFNKAKGLMDTLKAESCYYDVSDQKGTPSFKIMGYYETDLNTGETNGGMIGSFSGTWDMTRQFIIGYVPVYISLGLEVGVDLKVDIKGNAGSVKPLIEVSPAIKPSAEAGVGIANVLSVGVNLECSIGATFKYDDKISAEGEVGESFSIVAKALAFEYSWTFQEAKQPFCQKKIE